MNMLLVVLKEVELLLRELIRLQCYLESVRGFGGPLEVVIFALVNGCNKVKRIPLFGLLSIKPLAMLHYTGQHCALLGLGVQFGCALNVLFTQNMAVPAIHCLSMVAPRGEGCHGKAAIRLATFDPFRGHGLHVTNRMV
jgi:hypothetical protein